MQRRAGSGRGRRWRAQWLLLLLAAPLFAQSPEGHAPADEEAVSTARVLVEEVVADEAIATRVEQILEGTGWFISPTVRAEDGVVFLEGEAELEEHRQWAGDLAARTEGVVAVVNRLEVVERSMWDLSEAGDSIVELSREGFRRIPLILFGLLILGLSVLLAIFLGRGADTLFRERLRNALLRTVVSRLVALVVFLFGLYFVLRVSGLTNLAVTLLGGTGIAGLVLGFAFRDIAENFLASILMSLQRPFAKGDLIEVAGFTGFVQRLNSRSTLLMTLEGNHVQIPNATIYNGTIINFTANPLLRLDFLIGIGFDDSIAHAQEVALELLHAHEAVLADPEPLVLVETLGSSTVNLRFLFWIDIQRHSAPKVKSAVLRLAKRAFQNAGISMPDDQREVVFPEGVPVRTLPDEPAEPSDGTSARRAPSPRPAAESAPASPSEGNLESEAGEIQAQARRARLPEGGTNLLDD